MPTNIDFESSFHTYLNSVSVAEMYGSPKKKKEPIPRNLPNNGRFTWEVGGRAFISQDAFYKIGTREEVDEEDNYIGNVWTVELYDGLRWHSIADNVPGGVTGAKARAHEHWLKNYNDEES